ncbi:MAG: cysteine desulfurase [Rhodocyclaceae bacterium]|nr:cysteine desulfurase [Rhodocyclaceae bacterium]
MFAPVYLDHNATTPLDPEVREAMLPYLDARFGNPSSRHEYGRQARAAIEEARARVAASVGAHSTEVIFTSGGSEANNLIIKGAAARLKAGTVATSAIEHPCVREPARQLARRGWQHAEIAVDRDGLIDRAHWRQVLDDRPAIVSVMLANNESGVVQDVAALAAEARRSGALFHTDAVQAVGKIAVDFRALGVNAMTLSAHKVHGPLGIGALVCDKRVDLEPLVAGGGQERNLRSGTENVAGIVGFARACELAAQRLSVDTEHIAELRRQLESGLGAMHAQVFSAAADRLPGTSFFAFDGLDGETLVGKLDRAGFAVASGSACSSVSPEPSRTLLAMGVSAELAKGAIRVSLGRSNSADQVDDFLAALRATLAGLRNLMAVSA